jgi:hypothetical protein
MQYEANSFYPGPAGGYGNFNTHQACNLALFFSVLEHTFFPRTTLQVPRTNFQANPAPSENILNTMT